MEENIKIVVDVSIILSRLMPDKKVFAMFEDEYKGHIDKKSVYCTDIIVF